MSKGDLQFLSVDDVELDRENPRILALLEDTDYTGEINEARIGLALDAAASGNDGKGETSPRRLKRSIKNTGGISQPIHVIKENGKHRCIDGNTRLYIYRELRDEDPSGNWEKIPSLVYQDAQDIEIETIRLGAHLVGPRQWTPYSKAKYLYELNHVKEYPLSKIIDLVGGSEKDILQSIEAFKKMRDHYKPLFSPNETFRQDRYSAFKTYEESPKLKEAMVKTGFDYDDFASWLKEEKFKQLGQVRSLSQVLLDDAARSKFLKEDMSAALKEVEKPEANKELENATIPQLCRALRDKLRIIPHRQVQEHEKNPDTNDVRFMTEAAGELANLLHSIGVDLDEIVENIE
ncbi:MAG: ParB N-terminal domain-containing protein [Parasphingopyxis sp.]|uniref:hypothetical protein n=1 Tax=Parasphingopyxis sp. TaxID=1920299 RepID=UPI003FA0F35E